MWMKIDDKLHVHRKTRAVTKSHPDKTRDAAPMGIWALAGSWAADNGTEGWVPEDELDRWDDDWRDLVARLVRAGFWWPAERGGEPGYGFNDWHDYNDPADMASKSGTYGNHVRWHVNEKRVDPECEHCPKEPKEADDRGDIAPISGGDRGAIGGRSGLDHDAEPQSEPISASAQVRGGVSPPESGGDSRSASGAIALPEPDPNPNPNPKTSASADAERDREFEKWWSHYPRKVGKGAAAKAYRTARKKVDAATLGRTMVEQIPLLMKDGESYCPYASKWLNSERWTDEAPSPAVRPRSTIPHVSQIEEPPDGLNPEEYRDWHAAQRRKWATQ